MSLATSESATTYKKVAGTSAVFLRVDHAGAAPIERDGLIWTSAELAAEGALPRTKKSALNNVLALEGLEEYDPPSDGDCRAVLSLNTTFIYVAEKRAWVECAL